MSVIEKAQAEIIEYTLLRKRYLELEDWRMAEYCESLIKERQKEIITLAK